MFKTRTGHDTQGCCDTDLSGCGCGSFSRRFVTNKEEQEWLEEYKKQLQNELAGVEERMQEIKKK
jgi:coproporphyrinogen III oxidase-like Fe-S oxidoreductase